MKIDETVSDEAILKELGNRIAQTRLNQNITQSALSEEAGISLPTEQRAEHGHPVQTTTLIRILRALGLAENLESLIPPPAISPVQQLKIQGKRRKRASSGSVRSQDEAPWSWGDDE